MDVEFKAFALALCGYSLAILSYLLPWHYFIISRWWGETITSQLWFLDQSVFSLLFPQGPFVGGFFGLIATIVLTSMWWKNKIHLSQSLVMLNILVLPWIFSPSLNFFLGFRPSIVTDFSMEIIGQGDAIGYPINILSVICLGCAIACAIINEEFSKKKTTYDRANIFALALLSFCAILVLASGILPWDPYPRPFAVLPIAIGVSMLAAAFLTRVLELNTGLILALIWAGLELMWIAGLWLHGLVPVWSISGHALPVFYLSSMPDREPIGLGSLLLFDSAFIILAVICILLWVTTIHKYSAIR